MTLFRHLFLGKKKKQACKFLLKLSLPFKGQWWHSLILITLVTCCHTIFQTHEDHHRQSRGLFLYVWCKPADSSFKFDGTWVQHSRKFFLKNHYFYSCLECIFVAELSFWLPQTKTGFVVPGPRLQAGVAPCLSRAHFFVCFCLLRRGFFV